MKASPPVEMPGELNGLGPTCDPFPSFGRTDGVKIQPGPAKHLVTPSSWPVQPPSRCRIGKDRLQIVEKPLIGPPFSPCQLFFKRRSRGFRVRSILPGVPSEQPAPSSTTSRIIEIMPK